MAGAMSFARAFSTRRNKPELEIGLPSFMGRAASQRSGKPVVRTQISSPMALMSTSNAQVRHAQAIAGTVPIEIRNISSSSSFSSASEDSDTSNGSIHSSGTMTDASSVDMSPVATEPEPNHLTSYFKPAVDTKARSTSPTASSPIESVSSDFDQTPKIPQRHPSHSKRAHETIHRKRSIQRLLTPSLISREERTSTEIFNPVRSAAFVEAPRENPFGNELAELEEVAEEFGQVMRSADAGHMEGSGLAIFTAADYMWEIQSLVDDLLADPPEEVDDMGGFF